MRTSYVISGVTALAAFTVSASISMAASMVTLGSGVEARFGSQSNAYTDSDPTGLTWTAPGAGPYVPSGVPLPGLPGIPAPLQYPVSWGNPFQGTGWTSNFSDLGGSTAYAAATSQIIDSFNPSPTLTADAQINIPVWRFVQGPAALGYAFEQLNFSAAYGVTSNPFGLAGSTPAIPLTVNGVIKNPGVYAQFEGVIDYSWTPVNSSLVPTGPTVPLGQLTYSVTAAGVGPFTFALTSAGSLTGTPTGDGILELNGFMFVAGDPFEMTITIPEPAALSLLTLGGLALVRRRHHTL